MPIFAGHSRPWTLGGAVLAMLISSGGSAHSGELTGTLKKIRDNGAITIGHREASSPFSFFNSNKQPIGYAIDLCLKIVDEVKAVLEKPSLTIKYSIVNAQTRIPLVVDGTIDLECGSTTNTLARQQQVDFSPVYFTTGTRIENGQARGAQLVVTKDYAEGMVALETKKADAFATDDIVLFGLLAKSEKKEDLEVVGRYLTYDPYGIMYRRGDPDFRLAVSKALARVFRSGEIAKIYAKWFDPVAVPMSPLLKAGFELQALPE
jgi:glutamate/aspartate transport system substrate-binding protein